MHQAMRLAKIKYSFVSSTSVVPECNRIIFPFEATIQFWLLDVLL
jgi:hypothetical protein